MRFEISSMQLLLVTLVVVALVHSTASGSPCASFPCMNGGTCSPQGNKAYSCDCKEGYFGGNCQYSNPCNSNPCHNGGLCVPSRDNSFTCTCPKGMGGKTCDQEIPQPCKANPCRHWGSCTDRGNGKYTCDCIEGYTGHRCETEIPCYSNPCLNGGVCAASHWDYVCKCPERSRLSGKNCEIELPDVCHPTPCLNGGVCKEKASSFIGEFTCKCSYMYEGDFCENEKEKRPKV